MEPVQVKILGISGTPIKGGNCDTLIREALKAAAEVGEVVGGVETEFITLADKNIAMCQHCQWCIENRQPCKVKDDFHMISDRIEQCDGLILGGPTWFRTLAPPLLNMWSRLRYEAFFTHKFRNKPTAGLTLGYFGVGMEYALNVLRNISNMMGIWVGGAYAVGSTVALGQRPAYLENGVLDDTAGVRRVRNLSLKVVEIARMIKHAKNSGVVLPDQFVRTTVGAKLKPREEMNFADGVWREAR
jgi:multimeric flavodoxin WrbA